MSAKPSNDSTDEQVISPGTLEASVCHSFVDVPSAEEGYGGEQWVTSTYDFTKARLAAYASLPASQRRLEGCGPLPFLVYLLCRQLTRAVSVLNVGGAMGSNYIDLLANGLDEMVGAYHIAENEVACRKGRELFSCDSRIQFHIGLPAQIPPVDIIYVSTMLPYMENYRQILAKLAANGPRFMLFERLPAGNEFTEYLSSLGYRLDNSPSPVFRFLAVGPETEENYDLMVGSLKLLLETGRPVEMKEVPCPKCGSTHSANIAAGHDYLYHIPGEYYVAECCDCGLWFQNPRPATVDDSVLYPADYTPHRQQGNPVAGPALPSKDNNIRRLQLFGARVVRKVVRTLKNIAGSSEELQKKGIQLVPELTPAGRLLEIGCAKGDKLQALREDGWQDMIGIELVPAAADLARQRGFDVRCGAVEEILPTFADNSLDVVIASMVLEHLPNPFAIVSLIARKLKPGGQFLFSTISRDSLDAKIFGQYWAGFDFPRHMVHFRIQDIRDMVDDQFHSLEIFYQNAPVDYVRSATWRQQKADRLIRFLADGVIGEAIGDLLAAKGLTTRVSLRCRRR